MPKRKYDLIQHDELFVQEVKTPKKRDLGVNDLLPNPPFLLGLLAPRKSGKTNVVVDSLLDKKKYNGKFDKIYIWSQSYELEPKWRRLEIDPECVKTTWNEHEAKAIVAEIEEIVSHDPDFHTLFIWDDMIDANIMHKNSMGVLEGIAIRGRHANISVMIISQMYKSFSTPLRNNMTNMIIFRIRNKNELNKMVEENQESLSNEDFLDIYNYATSTPFSFLHINNQEPDPSLRFRKNWNTIIKLND